MTLTDFTGQFHPLLVHLPIGILFFAMILMVYGRVRNVDVAATVSLAWLLGGLSALFSCVTGWLLSRSGDYDISLVTVHQWTGLATAGLSFLTYALPRHRWVPAIATLIFLTIAGHYGGTLTHGEGFLSFSAKQSDTNPVNSADRPAPVNMALLSDSAGKNSQPIVKRTFFYRDQVVPVLETNCYSCHSARKKKGGLRLDSEAFIKQGGKNGAVLVAGNPQKSKLFSYLLLPHDDDMHMPPAGKRQLSNQQIAILHQWIKTGASFKESVEIMQPQQPTEVEAVATLPLTFQTVPPASDSLRTIQADPNAVSVETTILARPVAAPDQALQQAFRKEQIILTPIREGAGYVAANFVNVKSYQPSMLSDLGQLKNQLVRLRLSNQPVQDEDLSQLAGCRNINRLNLDKTRITDAGLDILKQLPNLEQLNLYGTAVTDAGLDKLAALPALKVLYLWQTNTTPAGIERLKRAKPGLKIDDGQQQLVLSDTNKTLKTQR